MKSRTSFSKLTSFKKDIFRFAPLWVLYGIVCMLILMSQGSRDYDRYACNTLTDIIPGFGVVNLIYAALVAQVLFGDLYNTRMCYSLHSLPQRRESWLLSHLGAGMLYQIVPNLLIMAFLMLRLEDYWYLALYWLLAMTVHYLFFLGLASVSALLSGNRIAALAIYAGFNFISMLIYATIQYLYIPNLTGVVANMDAFTRFCPVVHLYNFDFLEFNAVDIPHPYKPDVYDTFYQYAGLADGWGYTAIIGVVGLIAMGVSFWLYRIRHLECAGDFIAFPRLKSIACVIMTLCVTLCCALLGEAFIGDGGMVIWLAVGLIVGFFGSLMLLERRIKVFRKKTFLGFAIFVVVIILSFCAVGFDWFGIEAWTPKTDRVASVTVSNSSVSSSLYSEDYYYSDRLQNKVEDPAAIEEIIRAHEDILDRLNFRATNPTANAHRVTLTYKMKSGRTVIRSYLAPVDGVNYQIVTKYLYTKESVLGFTDVNQAAQNMDYLYLNGMEIYMWDYVEILQALEADYDAGNILYPKGEGEYYLEYHFQNEDGNYVFRAIFFSKEAVNLMKLMNSSQIQMGYADWDAFVHQVDCAYLDGTPIVGNDLEMLLEAIRLDVEAGTLIVDDYKNEDVIYVVEYEYEYRYYTFCIHKLAENTMTWIEAYMDNEAAWTPEGA